MAGAASIKSSLFGSCFFGNPNFSSPDGSAHFFCRASLSHIAYIVHFMAMWSAFKARIGFAEYRLVPESVLGSGM
jgi:hypothetical protein